MTRQSSSGATDTSSTAQGRFTVQLGADLRPLVQEMSDAMVDAMRKTIGVAPELSMAQVVTGIIKSAHAELQEAKAHEAAQTNGAGDEADVPEPDAAKATAGK